MHTYVVHNVNAFNSILTRSSTTRKNDLIVLPDNAGCLSNHLTRDFTKHVQLAKEI